MIIHTKQYAFGDAHALSKKDYVNAIPVDFSLVTGGQLKVLSQQLTGEIIQDSFIENKRTPNAKKKARLLANVDAAVANLFLQFMAQQTGCLKAISGLLSIDRTVEAYSPSTMVTRYKPEAISFDYFITKTVDPLLARGLIEQDLGYKPQDPSQQGYKTRIQASGLLLKKFEEFYRAGQLDIACQSMVAIDPEAEVIRLKNKQKRLIDYPETTETEAMRSTVRAFNEYLQSAPEITLDGIRQTAGRYVYRVFNNNSFDQGGRFYGGFWQRLSSETRARLLIDGEPVVELDYSSLHLSVLYNLKLGIKVPKGDLYDLSAYGIGEPGNPVARKAAKFTSIIMCNTKHPSEANGAVAKKLTKLRKEGHEVPWTAEEIIKAFMKKHKPLKEFFCTSLGLQIQRKDSDVVDKILALSVEQDIPVLPIHDSFIVRQSDEGWLRDVMESEYRNVMGFNPVVHAA
ncbi:hypothetical protein [Amphritea balenae]|uniref:DNA-directed DNA polymerase family A palm domain-containing protein n=1 Tax=Amphritea balenae TaxID=452629 RepID=A0A3P1SMW2_9GAMM|nr:hypothetical protein [Amphritea balenae]RRC98496.1 hypothetical protein EHS89_12805 [Amphritea balenae]GGK64982.1 hypothetical protein GCM10007941_13870 [Amphritea balenae]